MPVPESIPDLTPVKVTMIGTGGGGARIPVETPDHMPDMLVSVISPLAALLIRFVNGYLTTLVGLITAGMATNIIPAADFLHLVLSCAQLSLAGAGLAAMKDAVTIFGKLEQKYPLTTGSV